MMTNFTDIVLVEDNPSDVELTLHALENTRAANRIKVIRDGEEALGYLLGEGTADGRRPKCILLDLKLPKINGIEVLKRLKSNELTQRIPVVMLTSSREEIDLVKSYEYGANSYITKPADFQQFKIVMDHVSRYWIELNESPME